MLRRIVLTLGMVSLLLLAMINFVYAQESGPQSIDAPQSVIGTAFTYQGQLKSNGNPVNGTCDFQLYLYDSAAGLGQIGPMVDRSGIPVANGYFTIASLDFGSTAFNGEARWLRIDVRCPAGNGSYTTLTPRQPLTAAPYALALPGLYTQQNATSPNVIGGYSGNIISSTMVGSVIGGGGASGFANNVQANHATIGGGKGNEARGYAATISGGHGNAAGYLDTVGGGKDNTAWGSYATVPGGRDNTAQGDYSFAAGFRAEANHIGTFVWADSDNNSAQGTSFTSTGIDQFLIRAGGGVGINTTNTLASGLTVNGRVIAGGTAIGVAGGEPFVARGSNAGLSMDDRAGGANPRWVIFPNGGALNFWNGSSRLIIDGTGILYLGNIGVAGTTTLCRNAQNQIANCSSSARYKNNISALALGLETVAQLHPVTFDWTGTGEHDLGFVAEQVDQVTPLLTTRNAAGQIEGVKYDRVSAVLVKAVQEQQQQIAALQQQNIELQTRLANLDPETSTASFNLFNLLSVLACGGMIFLVIKQLQSKRGEA